MVRPPLFTYDRGGVPVELASESDWRRAVMRGHVGRDTLVTVFAADASPTMLPAGQVPELAALFDEVEQPSLPSSPAATSTVPPAPVALRAAAPRNDVDPTFAAMAVAGAQPVVAPSVPVSGSAGRVGDEAGARAGRGPAVIVVSVVLALLTVGVTRSCATRPAPVEAPSASVNGTLKAPPRPIAAAPATFATSFDCGRATSLAERTICGDAELARADSDLATLYAQQRRAAGGTAAHEVLRRAQRSWITRRARCADEADMRSCLLRAYAERTAALMEVPDVAEPPRALERAKRPTVDPEKVESAPTILCVLPDGSELRLPLQQCRLSSGVVMN